MNRVERRDGEWVGLAEAIAQLRQELEAARKAGTGQAVRLAVNQVELEFTAELRRSGDANVGLRWGIVSGGVKGSSASGSSHRLKLVLKPHMKGESLDLEVGDDRGDDGYIGLPSTSRS
jgi:hypothetical protein